MALQNQDNFIVGRSGTNYKISYETLKEDLNIDPSPSLSVGIGVITPTNGVQVGGTLTGSAAVTNSTGTLLEENIWELDTGDGYIQVQKGESNTYVTTAAGTVRYRKEATDDATSSPEVGAWSNIVTVTVDPNPDPDPVTGMHGLRFDSSRSTKLSNTNVSGSSSNTWTVSVWLKDTYDFSGGGNAVIQVGGAQATSENLGYNINGFFWNTNNGQDSLQSTNGESPNRWVHVVFQSSDTSFKIYVNGIEVASKSISSTLTRYLNVGGEVRTLGGQPTQEFMNGYLSAYYFVDGQALEPTVFGKFFEGQKWGPLPDATIEANISNVTPPTSGNYDQNWSAGATGEANPGSAIKNAFDGNLSTSTNSLWGDPSKAITYSFDALAFETLRVYIVSQANSSSYLKFNGVAQFVGETKNTGWYDIAGVTSPLTSIELYTQGSGDFISLYAVEADGQVLIDGPADTSQVWSDLATYNSSELSPSQVANIFNGDQGSDCQANSDTTPTITWAEGVIGDGTSTTVEIMFQGNVLTTEINGVSRNFTANEYFTIPEKKLISVQCQHPDAGQVCNPSQIRVNGSILIDAPPVWNTSQVWSEGLSVIGGTFYADNNARAAFDGNDQTQASSIDSVEMQFAPSADVPITTSFKINLPTSPFVTKTRVTLDGVSKDIDSYGFISIPELIGKTISTSTPLIIETTQSTRNEVNLRGISVDGKELVNQGSFGPNGFYLPFNPEATALPSITSSAGFNPNQDGTKAFDGDPTTRCAAGGPGATLDIKFPAGTSVGSSLEIYSGNGKASVNGGSEIDYNNEDNNLGWQNLGFTGTLDTIVIEGQAADPQNYAECYAIRIDGEIYTAKPSMGIVGIDASGQGNHFQDENFAVGNTDEVWSAGATVTNGNPSESNLASVFDGNSNTYINPASGSSESLQLTLANTLTATSSIQLVVGGPIGEISLGNGNTKVTTYSEGTFTGDSGVFTITLTGLSFPYSFNSIWYAYTVAGTGGSLRGILIDNEFLIDANIQDTVLDTPLFNYAVLETGFNGNLLLDNGGNIGIPATQSITKESYWEWTYTSDKNMQVGIGPTNLTTTPGDLSNGYVLLNVGGIYNNGSQVQSLSETVKGDVVGISYDPTDNVLTWYRNGDFLYSMTVPEAIYAPAFGAGGGGDDAIGQANFGQQPFVYATTQSDGTVMLNSKAPNMSQKWSEVLNSGGEWGYTPFTSAFNGDTASGANATGSADDDERTISGFSTYFPSGSGPYEVRVFSTPSMTNSLNGASGVVGANGTWTDLGTVNEINSIQVVADTGGAYLAGVMVNGAVLIDGPANNSQVWSNEGTIVNPANSSIPVGHGAYSITGLYDGNPDTSWGTSDADKSQTEINIPFTSSVEMVVNANGTASNIEFFGANGSSTKIETSTWFASAAGKPTINILTGGNGTLESPITGFALSSSSAVTGGLYAIELIVDGKQLIDAPDLGPFNKLYQTWAEYTRTTLGYALDRIAKLEKQRAADLTQIRELRTQITGALNRLASLESDEISDDAVDNALLTLVGSLSSQVTAWSTRIQILENLINQ